MGRLLDGELCVYRCMPGYGGLVNAAADRAFYSLPMIDRDVRYIENGPSHFSLLAFNHNLHWAAALSYEERGQATHFYCQHSDVEPEPGYLELLLNEMERVGADVISGVIAIKDGKGDTSTAIDDPGGWEVKRLSLEDCYRLPQTFNNADAGYPDKALLVNTGMLLVDLRGGWAREQVGDELRLHFAIHDRILASRNEADEYVLDVQTKPEDWNFSRTLHAMGRKVYATTAVRVAHHGTGVYYNDPPISMLKPAA